MAYILAEKINSGAKINRSEKNFITEKVNKNGFSKNGIPVLGVMINFKPVLKTFIVKQYGSLQEYNAIDKTSLRAMLYGKIEYIIERN